MSLSRKQQEFTVAIAKLVVYADSIGIGLTYGDAYATSGHMIQSCHYIRLAVDFNVFVEGNYIRNGGHSAWVTLHHYWSELGGSDVISGDENHFSFGWRGRR